MSRCHNPALPDQGSSADVVVPVSVFDLKRDLEGEKQTTILHLWILHIIYSWNRGTRVFLPARARSWVWPLSLPPHFRDCSPRRQGPPWAPTLVPVLDPVLVPPPAAAPVLVQPELIKCIDTNRVLHSFPPVSTNTDRK